MPNMRNSYMAGLGSYRPQREASDMAGEVQAGAQQQAGIAQQGREFALRARMRPIENSMRQFPGRMPNGTGETGVLGPQGWALMQQQQRDYLQAQNDLAGKGPLQVDVSQTASPYERPDITSARSAYNTMNRGATTPGYSNPTQAFDALQALYTKYNPALASKKAK